MGLFGKKKQNTQPKDFQGCEEQDKVSHENRTKQGKHKAKMPLLTTVMV